MLAVSPKNTSRALGLISSINGSYTSLAVILSEWLTIRPESHVRCARMKGKTLACHVRVGRFIFN